MLRKIAVVSMLMIASLGFSQQHQHMNNDRYVADAGVAPIPAPRAANTYAIYSLLLPGGPLNKTTPTEERTWAVADTTINITDMNPAVPPNGQLKAPAENTKEFEEALGDFEVRKHERFRITSDGFQRGHAPDLIDEQQVREIRQSGSGGVVFFSAVYFNHDQTAALVYVNQWCANLCSAGQWVYLEKHDGQWERHSGILKPGA